MSSDKSPAQQDVPLPAHQDTAYTNAAFTGDANGDPGYGTSVGNGHTVEGSQKGQSSLGGSASATHFQIKMSVADMGVSDGKAEEFRKQEEALRNRDPLHFCLWITKRPGLCFGVFLACHLFTPLITAILMRTGYDILPITFDRIPLDIRNDVDYLRGLAWLTRNDEPAIITRGVGSTGNESLRSVTSGVLEMVFHVENGNVFTKENLKKMKEVEDSFFKHAEFQKNFCQLDDSGSCVKVRSILRYFDGTYGSDPEFNNPNFDQPEKTLYKASTDVRTKKMLQYHLGLKSEINVSKAVSDITRSVLIFGAPLEGYYSSSDREEDQEKELELFIKNEFKVKAEEYFSAGVGNMKFVYFNGILLGLTITGQVFKDMSLALGSMGFIVLFVCLQTGSLWVGLLAILSIITSFCGANLIYRVILDYRYFGIFHVLAVFIILGIGADDIFVFYDTWKETGHHKYKSLAHRLSDCYRRASLAMLFTSVTTAIAFAVSATSPFLGIGSFGVFSCVLIIINYISVVTFFPCVVVTYHNWWAKYKCCCCCPSKASTETGEVESSGKDRKNPIVRFFRGPYYRFVTHKVAKWIILLFFAALLAVSIYFASQLKVNEEQVKFLPDNSNFGQYLSLRSSAFASTSETSSQISIVFGMKKQELKECHKTDPNCNGKPAWDDKFNLNSREAQQKLLDLCTKLRSLTKEDTDKLAVRRSLINDVPEVQCFVDDMKKFYETVVNRPYPVTQTDVESLMRAKPFIYNTSLLTADFDRHFEVALSYWLFNGFQIVPGRGMNMGSQLRLYNSILGEAKVEDLTMTTDLGPTGISYMYGTHLRYAAIVINTTIQSSNFGFPKGLPIRNSWENYLNGELSKMPDELKGGFQVCMGRGGGINVWHWFKVQEKLSSSAMMGIAIGICVSFPILVIATQNILVGFLATLTICCIACSVIAVIPLAGWKLGMLESLNLVLVVGLSVDYVVHLAEGYSRSVHFDRKSRTRSALEEVGISVLSGAVTTLGASVFLLGAFILFFTQFGIFMFSTIGFSILYALGFFITLIGVIGPEGEVGSLKPLFRWCGSKGCPCCKPTPPQQTANGTNGNIEGKNGTTGGP